MKTHAWVVLLLALLLAACEAGLDEGGGNNNGGPDPDGNIVSGFAYIGPMLGGSVTAFAIDAGGLLGQSLGSDSVQTDGTFSLDVGASTGPMVLAVSGSYIDEETGSTSFQDSDMLALVTTAPASSVSVTPITTIITERVLRRMSLGDTFAVALADTRLEVNNWFGIDFSSAVPVSLTSGPITYSANADYGAIVAGMSRVADDLGVLTDDLAASIAKDAADGLFDGMDNAVAIDIPGPFIPLPADAAQGLLSSAIYFFMQGPSRNNSGLNETDFTPLILRLSSRPDDLRFVMSIDVNPKNQTFAQNMAINFTATATMSDGTLNEDITNDATWLADDPGIIMFGVGGAATAGTTPGTTTIRALRHGTQGTTDASVTTANLVSIDVTPSTPTFFETDTQQFTAMGTYSDASMVDLTSTVVWDSNDTSVLDLTAGGFGTALLAGTSTVTATDTASTIFGDTLVTVNALVLVSIDITPQNPQIIFGQTQQFTAMGTYNNSAVVNITSTVAWNSSFPATLDFVGAPGLATAFAAGTITITAQDGPIMMTTGATVFVSYAVNVQPVFNNNCIGCHGPPAPEQGLNLTSNAGLMAGATQGSGAVVIPNDANSSILIQRLTGQIMPQMPNGLPPLPNATIQMIRDWINDGAQNN